MADLQPQAIDRNRVRARGGLEIDVEASREPGDRFAVHAPPSGRVALEADLVLAARRPTHDVSRTRRPGLVERDRVADTPRLTLLDRRRLPVQVVPVVRDPWKRDFKPDPNVEM